MTQTIKLIGTKVGTTRFLTEVGSTEVTLVELFPSKVVRHKTAQNDGYDAAVLAFGEKKRSKMNKPEQGEAKAFGLGAFAGLYEIRSEELPAVEATLSAGSLSAEHPVDVSAVSKGKGFAGTVKRYNFRMQDATHGNSRSHRVPGSTGSNQPGRVWHRQKMAGHMGHEQVTLKRRPLLRVDSERALVLIKGPIPGANGARVVLTQLLP